MRESFHIESSGIIDILLKWHIGSLEKTYPWAVQYDTIKVNRKGETVFVHDYSQVFNLVFDDTCPPTASLLNSHHCRASSTH